MASKQHNSRPNRESLSKRLGKIARQIKARDNCQCVYCGATEAAELAAGRHLQLDHLTTRQAGGQDIATNLAVACQRCNRLRRELTLAAWATKAAAELSLTVVPATIRAQARKALPAV